jgi:A/G-specific adenine glycosylase
VSEVELFKETVWDYYAKHARELPWRNPEPDGSYDPYKILVSELMLQQTQVQRVIPKYQEFLSLFPDIDSLAIAPLSKVIKCWQGLGYNRRAKYLHVAAKQIVHDFDGELPKTILQLEQLSGVGINTASAMCAYAYNQPVSFIETNIRTVYIHHFFETSESVDDKEILKVVEETCDSENPRAWYWALMDYGTYLKSMVGNVSRKSSSYTKQSTFEGSNRQIRGAVLRILSDGKHSSEQLKVSITDDRLEQVLIDLQVEGFITKNDSSYNLT